MKSINLEWLTAVCGGLAMLFLPSCGGSHSASSSIAVAKNSRAIIVNAGPTQNYANGVFTSVTICAPGSSNCQAVTGVLVDTGSYGLRILSTALGTLTDSLPQQKDTSGNVVSECAQFVKN